MSGVKIERPCEFTLHLIPLTMYSPRSTRGLTKLVNNSTSFVCGRDEFGFLLQIELPGLRISEARCIKAYLGDHLHLCKRSHEPIGQSRLTLLGPRSIQRMDSPASVRARLNLHLLHSSRVPQLGSDIL